MCIAATQCLIIPLNVVRLKDEKLVCELIVTVQSYLEKDVGTHKDSKLCRIYMTRIEHLYYKVGLRILFFDGQG